MITYELYCKLRHLHDVDNLSVAQLMRELQLNERTVRKWIAHKSYQPPVAKERRASKLDPFKGQVVAWLERHGLSAVQVLQRLRELGFDGGYSIVKDFVRATRPRKAEAYLTLRFEPGEAAQVDWGQWGSITVGSTQRRLSFLAVVLCHSRLLYVEFFLKESMEMFLLGQQRAFEFFGGVPRKVILDNLKLGVLRHHRYEAPVFNPRYLDFAAHHGFVPVACNVKAPHEKGRVENAVGYIKGNFLTGLSLSSVEAINTAVREWLERVANVRLHGSTKQAPSHVFAEQEKAALLPLPPVPYDVGVIGTGGVSSRCRVTFDTNHYSVPASFAGASVDVKAHPERLCFYFQNKLIATHVRSFDRHQDYELSEHIQSIKEQRPRGRRQRLLADFLGLGPAAETFYRELQQRALNPPAHLRKILALVALYGQDQILRALEDAHHYQAYHSDYILHIVQTRQRINAPPGPLHLTRRSDLLDLDIPPADIGLYDTPSELDENPQAPQNLNPQ